MLKRLVAAAVVVIVMLSGSAMAGPAEDADAAHERGDYATALRLLRPLAEQGFADAQYNLGFLYDQGEGVTQDYVLAHMWWDLAAARGNENAAINRDDLAAHKMTPDQITEAQRLAREWKPTTDT